MTVKSRETRHRSPAENRKRARIMRANVRTEEFSISEIAERFHITRTDYYRLVDQLQAWEAESTREEEIAELEEQFKFVSDYDSIKWAYVSGQRILNYIRKEDDISKSDAVVPVRHEPLMD